eukprot:scaffold12401_cov133-Isochrysis_galbana.AAC.8
MPFGSAAASGSAAPPETRASCCEKYRRIFEARNRTDEGAVPALVQLFHGTASVLLRHEAAYALGQMQRVDAVPFLTAVLEDSAEHPITRHEAAEALGAIEAPESLDVLRRHAADPASEVSETCGLALAQLNFNTAKGACGCERRPQEALRRGAPAQAFAATELDTAATAAVDAASSTDCAAGDDPSPGEDAMAAPYTYVTPAPAAPPAPISALRQQLLDGSLPLFDRYRALFALRDAVSAARDGATGDEAVLALCAALLADGSALLKHEVAFVLGQLEHLASVPALCAAVRREAEHPMVRHEAAEALGAVGTAQAISVLREHAAHPEEILRESCWVALQWVE